MTAAKRIAGQFREIQLLAFLISIDRYLPVNAESGSKEPELDIGRVLVFPLTSLLKADFGS